MIYRNKTLYPEFWGQKYATYPQCNQPIQISRPRNREQRKQTPCLDISTVNFAISHGKLNLGMNSQTYNFRPV